MVNKDVTKRFVIAAKWLLDNDKAKSQTQISHEIKWAAQEIAGHSSTKMTEKYTHISDAFKKKTISSIGNW